jgi:copper oxidase (laccase) domain-containing protein
MITTFGSSPENLLAGIGPSIGPDHYEVGQEVLTQFSSSFGASASDHIVEHEQRSYLARRVGNRNGRYLYSLRE